MVRIIKVSVWLAQKDVFGYGKTCHRVKDCAAAKQGNRDAHAQTQSTTLIVYSGRLTQQLGALSSDNGGQHHNWFYALFSHQEHGSFLYMVTGMLHDVHVDAYVFLDSILNYSFVTSFIVVNFGVSIESLSSHFQFPRLLVNQLLPDEFIESSLLKSFRGYPQQI